MGAVLTGGHTGHEEGHLVPKTSRQKKQREEKGNNKPERAQGNPRGTPVNMHTANVNCVQIKRTRKVKITQGKGKTPNKHYYKLI